MSFLQYDPDSPLLSHILSNARRYTSLFSTAIDSLLPEPTIDLTASPDYMEDVLDVIMDQRRGRNRQLAEEAGMDGGMGENGGEERFPPELMRR